jgi:hypothetical protein
MGGARFSYMATTAKGQSPCPFHSATIHVLSNLRLAGFDDPGEQGNELQLTCHANNLGTDI